MRRSDGVTLRAHEWIDAGIRLHGRRVEEDAQRTLGVTALAERRGLEGHLP